MTKEEFAANKDQMVETLAKSMSDYVIKQGWTVKEFCNVLNNGRMPGPTEADLKD